MRRAAVVGAVVLGAVAAVALGFGAAGLIHTNTEPSEPSEPFGVEPLPTTSPSPTPTPEPVWTGYCARKRSPYKVEVVYAHFGIDIRQWNPNKGRPVRRVVDEAVYSEARLQIQKLVSKVDARLFEQTHRHIKWACTNQELRVTNVLLENHGQEHTSFRNSLRDLGFSDPQRIYLGFMPVVDEDVFCGHASGDGDGTGPGYATVYWDEGWPGCWQDSTPLHELFHVFGAPHVADKTDLMHALLNRWLIDPPPFDYYDENRGPCQPGVTCFPNTAEAPYLTRSE